MSTALLIDGDIVAYRAAAAAEKTKYLVEYESDNDGWSYTVFDTAKDAKEFAGLNGNVWSRKELEPVEQAVAIAGAMIRDIKERYAKEDPSVHVFLSPDVGNYREQLATRAKYKGNRSDSPRPTHHRAVVNALIQRGANVAIGQEADDSLGIEATRRNGELRGSAVICSIDKDLWQIPGRHYHFVNKSEGIVGAREGTLFFYQQVLTGDASDNVPGIEGIGPRKAEDILSGAQDPKDCWERVLEAYKKAYGDDGERFALEAGSLLYIRKKPNEMWQPPK